MRTQDTVEYSPTLRRHTPQKQPSRPAAGSAASPTLPQDLLELGLGLHTIQSESEVSRATRTDRSIKAARGS